ncbi:MAG: hypothetical protein EOM12_09630 [Verrucomicrobiae bacterium]|nr:hypothetical protein [Bacteroidia bacterium]NCC61187.1 hypothetical protein [Verrucomicrobiae bacterium]
MKTTSTIKIKYPGHNTQKTAFRLCALSSDTPRREESNLRKADINTLQVDAIVNAKLTKGYRLLEKFVIHTAAPVLNGSIRGEADLLASCYRCSLAVTESAGTKSITFPPISIGVYGYHVEQAVS